MISGARTRTCFRTDGKPARMLDFTLVLETGIARARYGPAAGDCDGGGDHHRCFDFCPADGGEPVRTERSWNFRRLADRRAADAMRSAGLRGAIVGVSSDGRRVRV